MKISVSSAAALLHVFAELVRQRSGSGGERDYAADDQDRDAAAD
jgi:hypothetical protein